LRNQVQNGWKQIDVQLKRRHDLIPNLVNTVKGYMQYEQETLDKVIQARNAATTASGIADSAAKENALTGHSAGSSPRGKLPHVKASENVKQLQEELSSTENKIGFARQFFNDIATNSTSRNRYFRQLHRAHVRFQTSELFEVTRRGTGRAERRSFSEKVAADRCLSSRETSSNSSPTTRG